MIKITTSLLLDETEITLTAIRAPGPGGQNVNKVATAIQLRFDIKGSPSLPEDVRTRLLSLAGNRVTREGELIIKASRHRTQERNKQDALTRLKELIKRATFVPKKRKKTKPTFGSIQRRLTKKKLHAKTKLMRQTPTD